MRLFQLKPLLSKGIQWHHLHNPLSSSSSSFSLFFIVDFISRKFHLQNSVCFIIQKINPFLNLRLLHVLLLLLLLTPFWNSNGTVECTETLDNSDSNPKILEQESNGLQTEPITIANYSGDILIGAVLPIHEREKNYSCGALQVEGLQQLEALAFSLKRINDDPNILPGIKVGLMAIDSCDNPHHALEQTIDFIKSFVARNNRRLADHEYKCDDRSSPIYKSGQFDRVFGLIGGQSSEVSIQLANLLRLFQIPQVSFMSTSPTLSNKRLYEYFFRTVPSDTYQVIAIVELLRKFHWTYVSVVYSDTEYGNNGYDLLTETAARYNICISSPQAIDVERFQWPDYDNLITTLMHKINARVVILYTDRVVARKVMRAAERRLSPHRLDRFVWIASDAWCCREFVVHGLEKVVEGSISVTPLHYPLEGFDDHFRALRPENNRQNPWFREFWQQHFNCQLPSESDDDQNEEYLDSNYTSYYGTGAGPGSRYTSDYDRGSSDYYPVDSLYNRTKCNQSLSLGDEMPQSPSLHFVRDALYSFTKTFDQIHQQLCNRTAGICPAMWATLMDGQKLTQQLRTVTFNDEGGRTFRFLQNGDAPPRYSIVNFQQIQNGVYQWRPIGTYTLTDNETKAELILDSKLPRFKTFEPKFPLSFCSEPCQKGQAKLQLEGDTCCWLCTNCSQYQYLPDEFHCHDCPLGTIPGDGKTSCVPLPPIPLSITNWWTISAILFASVGILATLSTFVVFWHYADTPIIKASGRELSTLHLAGILLSFGTTFVIISPPTSVTCALTRFFLGFCYTVCYSAIVTKTNRIARIFRHRSCQRPRFTSPRSQLFITALLILIEMAISLFWIFYDPPGVMFVYPNRDTALLICSGSDRTSYLVGLLYPLVLIGFCTVYAFKTRKCPEGFNEARYITFTNYTTCVIWFAFLPLFVMLSTTTPLRSVTLCLLLSVSGTVQLFCLFVPKIYVALLKPEKNTRETVMCGGLYQRAMTNSTYLNNHHHHHHSFHQCATRNSHDPNTTTTTTTTNSSSAICCEESALTVSMSANNLTTKSNSSIRGSGNNSYHHHNPHPKLLLGYSKPSGSSSSSSNHRLPVPLGPVSSSASTSPTTMPQSFQPRLAKKDSSLRMNIDRYSTSSEMETCATVCANTTSSVGNRNSCNGGCGSCCGRGFRSASGQPPIGANDDGQLIDVRISDTQHNDNLNYNQFSFEQESQEPRLSSCSAAVTAAAIYWRQYKKQQSPQCVMYPVRSGSIPDQLILRCSSSCSRFELDKKPISPPPDGSGDQVVDLLSGDPLPQSPQTKLTPNGTATEPTTNDDVFVDDNADPNQPASKSQTFTTNSKSTIQIPLLANCNQTGSNSSIRSNPNPTTPTTLTPNGTDNRPESIRLHKSPPSQSSSPISLSPISIQSPLTQSLPVHSTTTICSPLLAKHDTVLENGHQKSCWPSVRLETPTQK